MFGGMVMLGGAWTLKMNEHVRVDLVYGSVSERTRTWIDLRGGLTEEVTPHAGVTLLLDRGQAAGAGAVFPAGPRRLRRRCFQPGVRAEVADDAALAELAVDGGVVGRRDDDGSARSGHRQ